MFDFLFQMRDIYVFALLNFVLIAGSILSVYLVRRFIPFDLRSSHNPVIGNVGAIIGLIYGVLVGLTALYLFNNLNYTSDAVEREASAVSDIYRGSKWLKDPVRTHIQTSIKAYLDEVINVEWPLMRKGQDLDMNGDIIIDNIAHALNTYKITNQSEFLIINNMLEEIKSFYNARQERINMSSAELSSETWIVILIGTFLTLGVNFIFGMNFKLHLITSCAAAIMCASMLFLIITLDRPFQGEFVIGPDAFQSVLVFIEKYGSSNPTPIAEQKMN